MMEEPILLPKEKIITYTPLVYNADTDFSTITNVLLVDTDVQDYNKFVENVNSSTFAITFSQGSKGQDIVDLLASKLPSINRISIVANDSMMASGKRLFSYKPYFESSDLEMDTSRKSYSENLQLLIDLIKAHSVQTIDFLACNSLTFDNWKSYYSILTKETGVTVGASSDQTGNILYGGDWTMESTGVDIEAVYFTSGISNYQGTLVVGTTIDFNCTLNMVGNDVAYLTSSGVSGTIVWPCTLEGTTTVTLSEPLTLYSGVSYFIVLEPAAVTVIIDGAGFTITVGDNITSVPNYPGLVKSRSNNTLVKNIGLLRGGTTTLAASGGWIGQGDPLGPSSFIGTIDNCYSRGIISTNSGGIAGDGAGAGNDGICNITNCHSTGAINGNNSGGIVGSYAGRYGGSCTITNCYSSGVIHGTNSGGIVGSNAEGCNISDCYSTGTINGTDSGGIAGIYYGSGSICNINTCYSTGNINGFNSGGIVGRYAGFNISGYSGICNITNCYSTGNINSIIGSSGCGGIAGDNAGHHGTCNIDNCYSTGIIGNNSGGIAGTYAGYSSNSVFSTCKITNCYVLGAVSNNSGGIVGQYAGGFTNGMCSIVNSYLAGAISNLEFAYFGPNVGLNATTDNCYDSGTGGGWTDFIASLALSDTNPNTGTNNGTGTNSGNIWKRIKDDFPWKLSSFLTPDTIVTYSYDSIARTLVYSSSKFPIVTYVSDSLVQYKIQLQNNGSNVGAAVIVDTTQRIITFNGVIGLANGLKTSLELLSNDSTFDYLDFIIIPIPTTTTTSTTTTTTTTTKPPIEYSEVEWATNAPYSLLNTDEKKVTYKANLKDQVVIVTDAPADTVTVLGVRPGSIINTVRLPTIYVPALQYMVQNGLFYITIDGVTYPAIPNSFIILDNICFKKGTMILTPNGYIPIETLTSNDFVVTAQGRITKIQSVVSFVGRANKCPLYVLKQGVLGISKPITDLYMSGGHAYCNKGRWCHMKCSSVAVKLGEDKIEYYNIVLDNYFQHTLVANGVEVESLFKVSGFEMTWNCRRDYCNPVISEKEEQF